jgi:hypothetical protein
VTTDDSTAPRLTLVKGDGPLPAERAVPPLPADVSRAHPIEIHVARPMLEAILEDNITTLQAHRAHIDVTPADKTATDSAIARLSGLLEWARGHQRWSVWVGVYPEDPTAP